MKHADTHERLGPVGAFIIVTVSVMGMVACLILGALFGTPK